MSRQWLTERERGAPWLVRLMLWIALNMPRGVARLVLLPITAYFYVAAPRARLASKRFLDRALGRRATSWDSLRHLHTFAATILDRVYFLTGKLERFDIRLHGFEALRQRAKGEEGALLIGAHLGSFEALRALAVEDDAIRLKVLMYPDHNQVISRLLHQLNPAVAETIIPLGPFDSLLKVKDCVDEGYFIGLLGDRVAESDKSVCCPFLGKETSFPAGPMILAHSLRLPLFLVFGLYQGGNRYDLHFEPLVERVDLGRPHDPAKLQHYARLYAERLEYYARLSPYNWFNFYDFWNEDTKPH
ncbi:MAG: lipid A biosynthesis acyltransferase [Pseudomonadota bacterium]